MARLVLFFALCVLPALTSAANPFLVRGRVYCDTCRAGFETEATPGIPGRHLPLDSLFFMLVHPPLVYTPLIHIAGFLKLFYIICLCFLIYNISTSNIDLVW